MASYTTNLNLKKPAGSENVAIGDINNNMDAIDQAYGTLSDQIAKQSTSIESDKISIYKTGYTVMMNFKGYVVNASGATGEIIPSGYRPAENWRSLLVNGDGDKTAGAFIRTDGKIYFDLESAPMTVYGTVVYPLAT